MRTFASMIKAVFFDIDGTLVSFKTHSVSESTRESIRRLRDKGIKVFIATGRARDELSVLNGIEFDGFIIMNGIHCYTPDGKDIHKEAIPAEDINRLAEWLETDNTPFIFVYDGGSFITRINEAVEEVSRLVKIDPPSVKPAQDAIGKEILMVMGYFDEYSEQKLLTHVLTGCDSMRWCPYFADIVARGNSKSNGINHILKHYNIKREETMAFGDGGNDIPMLKHVATGVAMGNAGDDVKAIADYITTSVDEDGINHALKHFGIL